MKSLMTVSDMIDVLDEMIAREAKAASSLLDRTPLSDRDQVVRRVAGTGYDIRLEALMDAKNEIITAGLRHHEAQERGASIRPDAGLSPSGASAGGYIADGVTYQDLVTAFGEPNDEMDGYKVDAAWILDVDGEVATIYNYKTGRNYLGARGKPVEAIEGQDWHVGTHGGHGDHTIADKINTYIKKVTNER